MTDPPLYGECVVGYRSWYVGLDATLWPAGWVPATRGSARVHRPWRAGVNTASCPLHPHPAPDLGCTCGLHALLEPPEPSFGFIAGAVAAWGRVQVHANGFRSEHAQITALVEPPGAADTAAIAARYRVPVVPRELLEREALRHGAHIDPVAVHRAASAALDAPGRGPAAAS
jgi:hypothetical protein